MHRSVSCVSRLQYVKDWSLQTIQDLGDKQKMHKNATMLKEKRGGSRGSIVLYLSRAINLIITIWEDVRIFSVFYDVYNFLELNTSCGVTFIDFTINNFEMRAKYKHSSQKEAFYIF